MTKRTYACLVCEKRFPELEGAESCEDRHKHKRAAAIMSGTCSSCGAGTWPNVNIGICTGCAQDPRR